MVDKSWYFVTPDHYYLGMVFTSKLPGSNGRAMLIYHVRGEKKARNVKYDSAQAAMLDLQRIASETKLVTREWK